MITNLTEARTFLDECKTEYSAYREPYNIEVEKTDDGLLRFNFNVECHEPDPFTLPITLSDFEEELARAYDYTVWANTLTDD